MNSLALYKAPALVCLALTTCGIGWDELRSHGADLMPVKYVRVEGAFQHLSQDEIKQVLGKSVKRGFYQTDLQQIQATVEKLPWADKVEVQRVWPDAIKLSIREQKPLVRWGKGSLLNPRGEVFVPGNINQFKNLPVIIGTDGQEKKLLEVLKGLAVALQDKAMYLKAFSVNDRRAWEVRLESGLKIKLGRKTPLSNIQRFLRSVEIIGTERVAQMAVVDLRYPNGFAVTWKPDAEKIDWKIMTKAKPGIRLTEQNNG